MKLRIAAIVAALLVMAPAMARGADEIKIDTWLVLGPAEPLAGGETLGADAALDFDYLALAELEPSAGGAVEWVPGWRLSWQPGAARFFGTQSRRIVFLAAYVEAKRWLQADLNLDSAFPVRVYLDGEKVTRTAAAGKSVSPLALSAGKHLLLVKGVLPADNGKGQPLQAALAPKPAFKAAPLSVTLEPGRRTTMDDVLYAVSIDRVAFSPDGRRVAVTLSRLERGAKTATRWLEVLDAANGERVFSSLELGGFADFAWLGGSRRFAFTRTEDSQTRFCQYDLDDRSSRTLLAGVKNFSSWWWADDGSFAVYATAEEADEDKPYRQVRGLDDRFRVPEPRQALFLFQPSSGARQPLSGFADNFSRVLISPDNRSLLLVANIEDSKTRPFHRNLAVLHDLASGKREKLLDDPWIEEFAWAPDSRRLLLIGGPSAFSGLGSTLPKETVPNDFDHQAYVFDLRTRKAETLTRAFAPSIEEAFWHANGSLSLKVTDQDYERLYRGSPAERKFARLETGCDAVESVSWSRAGRAAYSGSGLGAPQKLYVLDPGGSGRVLKDYNRGDRKSVV